MKLKSNSSSNFEPHPEADCIGVLVDVTPLKRVETSFGPREVFKLVFETNVLRDDGRPHLVWSRSFTPSLHEKAAFRAFLKQWFGRDLTAKELAEFDTESLIGRTAKLSIVHNDCKLIGEQAILAQQHEVRRAMHVAPFLVDHAVAIDEDRAAHLGELRAMKAEIATSIAELRGAHPRRRIAQLARVDWAVIDPAERLLVVVGDDGLVLLREGPAGWEIEAFPGDATIGAGGGTDSYTISQQEFESLDDPTGELLVPEWLAADDRRGVSGMAVAQAMVTDWQTNRLRWPARPIEVLRPQGSSRPPEAPPPL